MKRLVTKLTLICIFVSLPMQLLIAENDTSFEFNGMKLGSSLISIQHRYPEFSCTQDRKDKYLQSCSALMNFSQRPGVIDYSQSTVVLSFRDNQLVKIQVAWSPTFFKKTISDFKKYYGKPSKVEVRAFNTDTDNSIDNIIYYWQTGRELIEFQEYGENASQSSITYTRQSISESVRQNNIEIVVNWNDIAGKSAKGKDFIGQYGFTDYFSKNGSVVEIRDNGDRHRGKWRISNSGYLCFEWKNSTDCGQLKVNRNDTISFIKYNKATRRFNGFEYGKQ